MASTGIINGATQQASDPNAPQSSQQAAAGSIGAATPIAKPLGSASTSSTITANPVNQVTAAPTPNPGNTQASYFNQLNAAAAPVPSPTPTPTPTPAPAPSVIPAPSGIISSARQQTQAPASNPASAPAPVAAPAPAPTASPYQMTPTDSATMNQYESMVASNPNWQTELQGKVDPAVMSGLNLYAQDMGIQREDAYGAANTPAYAASVMAAGPQAAAPAPAGISPSLKTVASPGATTATPTATAQPPAQFSSLPPQKQTELQQQISSIYQSAFGRPPDAQGLAFWENAAAQNPNINLQQQIVADAQTQDQAANTSLNGSGSVSQNWTNPSLNPNNVAPQQDVWNAATGQWTTAPTATGVPQSIPTSAATYDANRLGAPTQLTVSPTQTVAGQLQNLENPNNPMIQQAETQAKQQANASGLLNSTMAITAGQQAAYNAALPVAEQDANTYNTAAATNASAANQFAVDNQNAINSANQFNAGAQNTLAGQQLGSATQQQIAQLQATTNTNIQNSTSVANAGSNYQSALNTIAQLNTDAQGKYDLEVQAYNTYLQTVQSLMAASGSSVPNVANLLQFTGVDPSTGKVDNQGVNPIDTTTPTPQKTVKRGIINQARA